MSIVGLKLSKLSKSIGLKQLSQKTYDSVHNLPHLFRVSIGDIDQAWDAIIYGASGNGKTNFTVMLLKALIQATDSKAEYISYEEGHGKTIQKTMIERHNMLEEVGNKLVITEQLSFPELLKRMNRKQSAKIWVIDSLQAAGFNYNQCKQLKESFVMSRKKKIIIYISWCEGREPQGSCAKAVKYYANIKMRVQDLVMFPTSRYGGNAPFVIYAPDAKNKWGTKAFAKILKQIPAETKKTYNDNTTAPLPATVVAGRVLNIETAL